MAVIKIKASIEKKDEKLKNVRDIIETLNLVYAGEKLLVSFKDKFQDWTNKVIKEWRSCNAEKSDEFQNSKLFRVLSTTFISVCFLEFFRCFLTEAPDMSYISLIAVYYLLLVVMDLTSVVLITYLRSPSIFFYQIYEYFEMVLCMYRLLNRRINYVQRIMKLSVDRRSNLPPDIYAFEENSSAKFSYTLFSLYCYYGIYLAFCICISFFYFHYESSTVLTYLTFSLLFIVAASKVFAILKFLRQFINRKKNVQALTDRFKVWFDTKCELKRILQESGENTKIFSAFSHLSSKTFPPDEYLNFLIFAVTCEGIFRSNFNDQDLEKALLVLLYGQFSVLKDDSKSNQFIQITTSCNSGNGLIKSTKFLDVSATTTDDEKHPKNKIKTNKMVKSTDRQGTRENMTTNDTNMVAETFQNKKGKSQIPRYVNNKTLTHHSSKTKVSPVPTSNASMKGTPQPTYWDENLGNLNDLPDKQKADLVNHSNSSCNEENDEVDLMGIAVTPSIFASNANTNATLQPTFYDENLVYQKGPITEENAELVIHSKSPCEEKDDKEGSIRTPVTPLISESNTVTKSTLLASSHGENLKNQNDLSAAEQETSSAIHSNPCSEETKDKEDLITTPVTPLISESNTVTKTTLQASSHENNLDNQNDLSAAEQDTYSAIHSNPCSGEKKDKEDLITTPVTPLISESNTVTKTTLQASSHEENLEDQNDLSAAEQKIYSAIHSNSCSEENNTEIDLNVISGNEETHSISTLLLAVDTSGNCYKVDSKTDFINKMDLSTGKEKEFSIDKENIEADITCYNGNEIIPTSQNSNIISRNSEPSTNSVTDSKGDTESEVKTSNGNLDESSDKKVENVTRSLLSNKKNVIDGPNDDVDFNINFLSDPDVGEVKCIDQGNESNAISLQESEEIGAKLGNELPNKNLDITSNNESKLVRSQSDRMQSCNSIDLSENKIDDFKRPETSKEENLGQINFCQTRDELPAAQEIYSSNESETMRELLELISNQNFYLDMNGYLTSNYLSDTDKETVESFISACRVYFCNQNVESMGDPKTVPKTVDDNDLAENFSKLNIQSVDTTSISCNKNSPKLNSNENFHGSKIKGTSQIEDILMEPNKIPILDPAFTSSSSQTENTPKLKSSVCMDTEQKITPNCSEQTTSNNDVKQYGDANESQETFLTPKMKELKKNSSGTFVLIKEGEKYTADACNRNNESGENLPHFESIRNHMRDDLKPDGTICNATFSNSEINKLKGSLSKCTEMLPIFAKDALNHNGSEPKLPTENLCQAIDVRTETFYEIKAKAEEASSTTPEINEPETPEDITTIPANNSASPRRRIILKGKRRTKKVSKKRQGNKKEGGVIISELQGSENVDGIATESSIFRASEHETSTSKSENFTNLTWESLKLGNFANYPLEIFQGGNFTNDAWENYTNRNNQNDTTKEYVPSGEINTSQVLNESEIETPVNSVNLNDTAMINNKNVESIKTSAQSDNANVVLSTGELDGNVLNKSLATMPVVSILNPNKSEELISQAPNSVPQNEVNTNLSIFKSSKEDSNTNSESKQMSGDLISSMKTRSQASIPPVINETLKNTSEENICKEQTTQKSEKGVSNQKDQIKGERDNSCDSYADEQREYYKNTSAVRNVKGNCDSAESSSDLNRETYISLNERKILVADSSQMCNDVEEYNALDNISLDVTPHCSKEVFQNTICKSDEILTDGGSKNFCNTTSFLTSGDHSLKSNKSASHTHIKRKGQTKIRYTDDSAAVNDETGKENVNSEENCDKKWNTEITRKKDKRYVCLQKFRGIVAGDESNTEICELKRYESQASYVSSCEKLSMTKETTSLKMVDKRNSHSENARKANCKEFSEKYGFEQESGAKNKEIKDWISSISSPEESSTLSERLPTGSSEDGNFRLHPSTSVSNSNASKNVNKYSNLSVDSPVCTSFLEEKQSNYDHEPFFPERHLKNMSNTLKGNEKGTIKWESNLGCNSSEKSCTEYRQVNDGRSATNECLDLERQSIPVNYHLKCDNLDIRILDSQPNLTFRFVKETENESHPVPKNRKLIKTLTHFDSTDEIILPTDTSSLHDGHFSPTHPLDIPKISNIGNTLQISAERLPTNLDHQNASTRDKVFSFDNFLTEHTNSQGYNESPVKETINDQKYCPYPVSEVNEMQKLSSSNQGHNDIRPSEDSEYHQKSAIASTSNDSKVKPDANVSAHDPELGICEKSNDFIFESEIMKINYIPYSNSESISISFRRHRKNSKLTFKSQEKKFYLKTGKSSVETDF